MEKLVERTGYKQSDAGQTYASKILLGLVEDKKAGRKLILDKHFIKAFGRALTERNIDKNLLAAMMTLPSESNLANQSEIIDPGAIHFVWKFVKRELGRKYFHEFSRLYATHECYKENPVSFEPESVQKRTVANIALEYLISAEMNYSEYKDRDIHRLLAQFRQARNMTDKYAALSLLVWNQHVSYQCRKMAMSALENFYEQYKDDGDVVDKWLAVQATYPKVTVRSIKTLLSHPAYDAGNPNRVRALVGNFSLNNPVAFHAVSGEGYQFFADFIVGYVEKNPTTAANLVEPLTEWKRYEPKRSEIMKEELLYLKERLSALNPDKTKGVMEKVNKSLAE